MPPKKKSAVQEQVDRVRTLVRECSELVDELYDAIEACECLLAQD